MLGNAPGNAPRKQGAKGYVSVTATVKALERCVAAPLGNGIKWLPSVEDKESSIVTSTQDSASPAFDIAIVGGGLVGLSLARALEGSGLEIALIDRVPPTSPKCRLMPSMSESTLSARGARHSCASAGVGLWTQAVALHL